jgi:hypothetical protein
LLKNILRVEFKFELAVPKDKTQIPLMNYSSSEEGDNENDMDDEDLDQMDD